MIGTIFMRKLKQNLLLIVILIIASLLRFSGTKPGYPPYHSDEGITYSAATSMIKNGNLDPLRYDYPVITPLTNFIFYKFVFMPVTWMSFYFKNISKIADGLIKIPLEQKEYQRILKLEILGERDINALFWGRYVTAFFGVGIVYLTYLIGKKLFDKKVGLISAFLVAINYREVLNSHFGLPDIYNSFFLLLAFLVTLSLLKRPSFKKYLITGVFIGLSFSVKYQIFSFFSLFVVHLFLSFKKEGIKERLKYIFSPRIIAAGFVAILVFLVLNPYHLIKIEETIGWLSSVSGKYRTGRMKFDFFPYSYLYHIGIGKIVSIISILGIILGLIKNKYKSFLLLTILIPFFFVTTYYTGGGFYTRNFVTIIPFVLIFAGYFLRNIFILKNKTIALFVFIVILLFLSKESLTNSLVVAKEYKSRWNIEIVSDWISQNIPEGSIVAAHSSVPLPVKDVKVIPYNFDDGSFSLEEFKNLGADFIVINLDWATVNFYGWMAQDTAKSLEYWDKPIALLEQSFAAMAIREISDYAIYWILNPWQAPDSSFVVAKVPEYKVSNQELFERFSFLPFQETWQSAPIDVSSWGGYALDYTAIGEGKDYIYLSFYRELGDVGKINKRVAVRLSSRDSRENLVGKIPEGVKYMTIVFDSYNSYKAVSYLEKLVLYRADVEVDFSGFDIKGIKIDNGIIFPNSHGNL